MAATLRDYLQCEYNAKVKGGRKFDKDTVKGSCPKVPQQPNFSDCGIFVLQYCESFFEVSHFKFILLPSHNWLLLQIFPVNMTFLLNMRVSY